MENLKESVKMKFKEHFGRKWKDEYERFMKDEKEIFECFQDVIDEENQWSDELICPHCGEKIEDHDILTSLDIWMGKRNIVICPHCHKDFYAIEKRRIKYKAYPMG